MSMERLNRAAMAAGFAMAAPDDDEDVVPEAEARVEQAPGRQVAVRVPQARRGRAVPDMLAVASTWVRSILPASMGGRATA